MRRDFCTILSVSNAVLNNLGVPQALPPGEFTSANSQAWLRDYHSTASSSGWTPLGRGSDGRFGLRRFRAKLTPTPFGTHRAFTHALPPSFGLRSVPFTVPACFFPLPLK
jgi:hypothetical protein